MDTKCKTYLADNGYTNITICNCKYGSYHCENNN